MTANTCRLFTAPGNTLADKRAYCLGAGDSTNEFAVSTQVAQALVGAETYTVADVAKLYAEAFASFRRQRAEEKHLYPLGLNLAEFRQQQRLLKHDLVDDLTHRLRMEMLGFEVIVAGVDPEGEPHIYSVGGLDERNEEITYETQRDKGGFWSIGSGCHHFDAAFMAARYDMSWQLPAAALLMYSAKKKAESAQGVGEQTDMFLLNQRRFLCFDATIMSMLHKAYDQIETQARKQREEAERQLKDAGLLVVLGIET